MESGAAIHCVYVAYVAAAFAGRPSAIKPSSHEAETEMPMGATDHKLLPLTTLVTLRFGQVTTVPGLPLTAGVEASVGDGREGPLADVLA